MAQRNDLIGNPLAPAGSAGADRGLAFVDQTRGGLVDRNALKGKFIGDRAQHALVELGRSERRRRRIAAHLILEGVDVFHRFRLRRVERRQDGFANRRRHGYAALDAEDLAGLDIVDEEVDELGGRFAVFSRCTDAPDQRRAIVMAGGAAFLGAR